MTIQMESTKNPAISDFLIKVTEAESFSILEKAFKKVRQDFAIIREKDGNGHTKAYVKRFQSLEEAAEKILKRVQTEQEPSIDERAVFGEMVALRDFCFRRLKLPV